MEASSHLNFLVSWQHFKRNLLMLNKISRGSRANLLNHRKMEGLLKVKLHV